MNNKKEIVINVKIIKETAFSYFIREYETSETGWLPKNLVYWMTPVAMGVIEVNVPEWWIERYWFNKESDRRLKRNINEGENGE